MKQINKWPSMPYPGLRPFEMTADYDESLIFFGRKNQIYDLIDLLAESHLIAVLGPSGCGKSSLVRAGLIPYLEKGYLYRAGASWITTAMEPGGMPIKALAKALHEASTKDKITDSQQKSAISIPRFEEQLRQRPDALVELFEESTFIFSQKTNFLILIDQFEELFRADMTTRSEAIQLINLILNVFHARPERLYIVITMRTDFIEHCAYFQGLPEALNQTQYLTPRLNIEELREAIVKPIRMDHFGGDIEPSLIHRLLNDMSEDDTYDPDRLPLMQHALMWLWQISLQKTKKESGQPILTLSEFEVLEGLKGALPTHANLTFESLSPAQKKIAEAMFRLLSELGPGGHFTRRITTPEEISKVGNFERDDIIPVIETFADEKSCFVRWKAEKTIVDVSHESLIRKWGRLTEWAKEEARKATKYKELLREVKAYEAGKAGLMDELKVKDFRRWWEKDKPTAEWTKRYIYDRDDKQSYRRDYNNAKRFLDESEEKVKQEKAEKEEEQRRKIKMAQEQAIKAKKQARQNKIIAIALGLLATIAILAAGYAYFLKYDIKIKEDYSVADKIANSVGILTYKNRHELSVLLTLSALNVCEEHRKTKMEKLLHSFINHEWVRWLDNKIEFSISRYKPLGTMKHIEQVLILIRNSKYFSGLLPAHDGGVNTIDLSRNGESFAFGGKDRIVRVYEVKNIKNNPKILRTQKNIVMVKFGNVINTLNYVTHDGKLFRWNLETSKPKEITLGGYIGELKFSAFSGDGKRLVYSYKDGTTIIWDIQNSGKIVFQFVNSIPVTSVALSHYGDKLAVGMKSGALKIWDLRYPAGKPVIMHRGSKNRISFIKFSHDAKYLICEGDSMDFEEWDLESRKLKRTNVGQGEGGVTTVTISNDGKYIISGYKDGRLKVWDLKKESEEPHVLHGHKKRVLSLSSSLDSNTFVSLSKDGEIRIWKRQKTDHFSGTAKTFEEIEKNIAKLKENICKKVGRSLTPNEWKQYIGDHIHYRPICYDDDPAYLEEAGRINAREGLRVVAVEQFRKANVKDPEKAANNYWEAWKFFTKGKDELKKGNFNGATKDFDKAKKLDYNLKENIAKAEYQEISNLEQEISKLAGNGNIDDALNKYDSVKEFVEETKNESHFRDIYAKLFDALCYWGAQLCNSSKVIFACDFAVDLEPENEGIVYNRGVAYVESKLIEKALVDFNKFKALTKKKKINSDYIDNWINELNEGRSSLVTEYIEKNRQKPCR